MTRIFGKRISNQTTKVKRPEKEVPQMKFRILTCITAMTLFAALAVPVRLAAQDPPRYTVQDLGTLGGTYSEAHGLSNAHWLAGESTLLNDTADHAFLWRYGRMTDLGTLGGPNSFAWHVNDNGDAVGAAESSTTDPLNENWCSFNDDLICLPFLWRNDGRKMIPLPTLGGNNGFASEINNQDEAAGQAENTTIDTTCTSPGTFLQDRPVIWIRGRVQELPIFPGDSSGAAWAINDWGQVAGNSGDCTWQPHALLWQNGRAIDLGGLGGKNNLPFGINNRAQVVGYSDLPGDTTYDAFLWQKSTGMIDLGTLPGNSFSGSFGINRAGQVVGGSWWDAEGNERAFLWQNGVMTDLNTLIPPDSPLFLWEAEGINDQGQIVGLAYQISTGDFHAFLATPTWGSWAISERPKVVVPENARKQLQQRRVGRFGGRLTRPQ